MSSRSLSTPEAILAHCGAEALAYARNKSRGGRSGAKGRDYELLYGAYRLALAAANEFQIDGDGSLTVFEDQVLCFVDDLVIEDTRGRRCSQLRSGVASWSSGIHPLADDFRLQRTLDAALGLNSAYEVVVSTPVLRSSLVADRPKDLSDVEVVLFTNEKHHWGLETAHPELEAALRTLSLRPPEEVVREQVFNLLLAVWLRAPQRTTLRGIIETAAQYPGALIGTFGPPYALPDKVAKLLCAVPGFTFEIKRNHFFYTYGEYLTGVAGCPCGTPAFREFELFVIKEKPESYRQLHAELRRMT